MPMVWPKPGVKVVNEYTGVPYPADGVDVPLPYTRLQERAFSAGDLLKYDPGGQPPTEIVGVPPYTQLAFTTSLPFDGARVMAEHTVGGPLEFAPVQPGSRFAGTVYARLVANGLNTPTFAPQFVEHNSSAGYDNRPGAVNLLNTWFDGSQYFFSWTQALVQQVAPVALRFTNLIGTTQAGDAVDGFVYTGTGGGAHVCNTPNFRIPAGQDASVEWKWVSGAMMVALDDSATTTEYWLNANYAAWVDNADANRLKIYTATGGIANPTVARFMTPGVDWIRLRRTGTSVFLENSINGRMTWSILHTWTGAPSSVLYPLLLNSGGVSGPLFVNGMEAV
jgi:hypothetical protein